MKRVSLFILVIALFTVVGCEKMETPQTSSINGVWKVKSINVSGELTNIDLPSDNVFYSNLSIEIPAAEKGYIEGNTFYNRIEFEFEINEYQQIHIHNCKQYIENELLVHLKPEVDATEFAAYSEPGITPKRCLSPNLNIWLFETDGTASLKSIIGSLSQHADVIGVSYNNAGIAGRDGEMEVNSFIENMQNTVKFEISNNELKFMDSQNNRLIVFVNLLNEN